MFLLTLLGCAGGNNGFNLSLGGGHREGPPWTIRCIELTGPDAAEQVEQVAATLKRTPGIRPEDVFVHRDRDGYARLYYGTYYRRKDPKTGEPVFPEQLRTDLALLRELGDSSGRRYFVRAIPVRKPEADVGNPPWDLRNVDATYTLQVAAFEPRGDFWQFKTAAAEYCAYLRDEGFEAYYHHGPASSVVTVGTFGPDAVITGADGRTYYSREVQELQQHELLKYNVVNGAIVSVVTEDGSRVPVPSRLVEVPRSSPGAFAP